MRNRALKKQFPHLYILVRHKHDIVASMLTTVPLHISFRRSLRGTLRLWHNLVAKVVDVRLNDNEDEFRWGLSPNGIFQVRSMYNTMIVDNIWNNRLLWKLKLPLKIKVFCGI
jgi:hypothetical protein